MEITNNQVNPVTLEGVKPTKVSDVAMEKSRVEQRTSSVNVAESSQADQESTQNQPEELQQAVSQINDYVQTIQRTLQFTVDEKSGRDVVTVLDTKTEEVIRQYPSEEVLALARQIAEQKEDAISLFSSHV